MYNQDQINKILIKIEEVYKRKPDIALDEADFMVNNIYGGNIDDAFWGGVEYGSRRLATELKAILEENTMQAENYTHPAPPNKYGIIAMHSKDNTPLSNESWNAILADNGPIAKSEHLLDEQAAKIETI